MLMWRKFQCKQPGVPGSAYAWTYNWDSEKWTSQDTTGGGFPPLPPVYCCTMPFAGCMVVSCKLQVFLFGSCFGFGMTFPLTRALDGAHYGGGPICGGTSTVLLKVYEIPGFSWVFVQITVGGITGTIIALSQGCSPPTWSGPVQAVTLGACCGTAGVLATVTQQ